MSNMRLHRLAKRMRMFDFNRHGVCTNPNIIVFEKRHCRYQIETASVGNNWIVGYTFSKSANGLASPCTANHGRKFISEKEAIRYAAKEALDFFKKAHYTGDNSTRLASVPKDVFSELQSIIKPMPRQLLLFNEF